MSSVPSKGREDLLTPQVIGELENGMDTELRSESNLTWVFSGCQFIGAQAARAGTIGLVVASSIAAAPSAPLIVAGGVTGEFLTGMLIVAGEAKNIHVASKKTETAEEIAFTQRYDFALKSLLRHLVHHLLTRWWAVPSRTRATVPPHSDSVSESAVCAPQPASAAAPAQRHAQRAAPAGLPQRDAKKCLPAFLCRRV